MKLKESKLTDKEIINAYKLIKSARKLDERLWQLNRIGKSTFNISGQGAEVGQVAMALACDHEKDYFLPYYRDMAASMAWGMTEKEVLMGSLGKKDDPSSHGRQMPNHYGAKLHNIVSFSSTVTTQFPLATGVAMALMTDGKDGLAITATGEGSTAEGDFHEALNFAGIKKLPVIFVVENNDYAISTPNKEEFGVKHVSDRATGYGIFGKHVDGRDFAETYLAFVEAVKYARDKKGASLIEMSVDRLTAHSSDDDQRVYRSKEELEEMKQNDAIITMEKQLVTEKILTKAQLKEIEDEIDNEINTATDEAENMPDPTSEDLMTHIYE